MCESSFFGIFVGLFSSWGETSSKIWQPCVSVKAWLNTRNFVVVFVNGFATCDINNNYLCVVLVCKEAQDMY